MHVLCVRWPWSPCVGLFGLILLSECWTLSIHLVVSESDCVDWFYCPCVWLSGLIVLKDNLGTIVWWDSFCVSWNDIWGISVSVTIIYGLHPTKMAWKLQKCWRNFQNSLIVLLPTYIHGEFPSSTLSPMVESYACPWWIHLSPLQRLISGSCWKSHLILSVLLTLCPCDLWKIVWMFWIGSPITNIVNNSLSQVFSKDPWKLPL